MPTQPATLAAAAATRHIRRTPRSRREAPATEGLATGPPVVGRVRVRGAEADRELDLGDPLDAWRQIPDLPENVTLLEGGPRGVVAVKRDDKVVARVGTELVMPARKKARTLRDELRSASQRAVPFKIGVLASGGELDDATLQDWYPEGQPNVAAFGTNHDARSANSDAAGEGGRVVAVDYVALGGGSARRTLARRRGIAHDPGPLQGRGPQQSGPRGCTLVTVEADGTLRCDFLPAASVRDAIKSEIRGVTGLDPVLGDDISLSLFPSGSVRFRNVVLAYLSPERLMMIYDNKGLEDLVQEVSKLRRLKLI